MKVLIAGRGKSGLSAYCYLKKNDFDVEFINDELLNCKNLNLFDADRLFAGLSFIVVSPGISLDLHFFKEVKKRKIKVIGELELGVKNLKGKVIAVTGTNGKTTTVSLMYYLLKSYNSNVYLCGNIGTPVTSICDKTKDDDITILECSSYQLESVKNFHADISVILNLSADHLQRHKNMKNYIKAKQKIALNQCEDDCLILNSDDCLILENIPKTKASIYYYSLKNKVVGCYLKKNCIYFNDNKKEEKLLSLKNIKLIGEHNVSNVLAACLSIYLLTQNKKYLQDAVNFNGVEHRIEYVKTINGIAFYNDSKATNVDSTIVALKSFNNEINLIIGGSDKGCGFDELFKNMPKNVKNIAIIGQTKQKIAFFAEKNNFKNYQIFNDLKSAVMYCFGVAKKDSIILLSPACASFDCFLNYEERGNVFKKIVKEIALNEIVFAEKKERIKT